MNESDDIKLRTMEPDEFKRGILSGEIQPHDVEITITFKNGNSSSQVVSWNEIVTFYRYHDLSVVNEYYEFLTGYHGWA